jgi:hypothetical protein
MDFCIVGDFCELDALAFSVSAQPQTESQIHGIPSPPRHAAASGP